MIRNEADHLAACWRQITEQAETAAAPARLFAEADAACRALRNFAGAAPGAIVIDGAETLNRVRGFCEAQLPWLTPHLSHHKGGPDLFEAFGVAEQIDAAFAPTVGLAGGGSLIISQMPALTAVDVNTGGTGGATGEQTALKVNLEAAAEVARQIRLRNISGLIVVDFVSFKDDGRKRKVLDALKQAAVADPLGLNVVGYTRMGLVEMTRPRHGLSLGDILGGPGPQVPAASAETQALEALRRILAEATGGAGVTLRAPEGVIAALKGAGGADATAALALQKAQDRLGLAIGLEADQTLADGQFQIIVGNGAERP